MLYKPNFCCNCGEKIERVEWNLLTSRRFCPACSVEQRRHDYPGRIAVVAGSLAVMFGFGSLWAGSQEKSQESIPQSVSAPVGLKSSSLPSAPTSVTQQRPAEPAVAEPEPGSVLEKQPAKATPSSAVSYCGALTKKGTPCSRKVKSKGLRCFQHEGRPEAPPSD